MSRYSGDSAVRYLRVKRKTDDDPCFCSREYKRCKYIASVKSNLLQDILKVVNNQNVSETDIIDVNQDRTGEENEDEGAVSCNGVASLPNNDTHYVYDIYSLQDIDSNLYSLCEEDEECSDDSDSNDENNPRNDYPEEDDYHYKDIDYYGDWQDEEDYKLREQFESFGVKDDNEEIGSSSDDSLQHYDESDDADDEIDPDEVDVPLAKK